MAIASTTVFEVRTTGSDANGGGFNAARGGTDYSQQNAPQATGTVTSSSTTVTATANIFTAAMVGNLIADGTTWKEITAYTSPTVVTVDSAPSWTAASIAVGGALASPGKAGGIKVAGNNVYIQSGTYTLTAQTANVAGGVISDTTGGASESALSKWVGYATTRTPDNADASKPTISAGSLGAGTYTILSGTAAFVRFHNLIVDCNSQGTSTAFSIGSNGDIISRCDAKNFTKIGISLASSATAWQCTATGGTSAATTGFDGSSVVFVDCVAYANACLGFRTASVCTYVRCQAYGQTNSSSGFGDNNDGGSVFIDCVSQGNAGSGFDCSGGFIRSQLYENCIASENGGSGWKTSGAVDGVILSNCAGYLNTSGNYSSTNILHVSNFAALTGDPFVNAAAGNFALNNTAGAGASCRGQGFPGAFPGGLTTGYIDIGVAQHQDAGGGSSVSVPSPIQPNTWAYED